MKFHWGHGLILFFVCYISYLVVVVVRSASADHSLVADNYYEMDINYQKRYDKIENSLNREKKLKIELKKDGLLHLDFGKVNNISGEVTFYRSSNSAADVSQPISQNADGGYTFDTTTLKSGKWIVKVEWAEGDKGFYQEEDIFISNS